MSNLRSAYENQTYYEWNGLGEFWTPPQEMLDRDFPTQPPDPGVSLAASIIETQFQLPLDSSSRNIGSYLPGYDVVNKDAYQMVQLSLAAELRNRRFYECYADGNGIVRFYSIGEESVSNLDILYDFETGELKNRCDMVVVEGYDPPVRRITDRGPFDLLTFGRDYPIGDINNRESPYYDPQKNEYPKYWVWTDYLGPEGCVFAREGCIEYLPAWGGSHMDTQQVLDQAGVVRYYEFEQMAESYYKKTIPFYKQGSTQVEFSNKSTRYYYLDGFGELMDKTWKSGDVYYSQYCIGDTRIGAAERARYGVILPDSDLPKFIGVKAVYVYGYPLNSIIPKELQIGSINRTGTTSAGASRIVKFTFDPAAQFLVDVATTQCEPIALTQGEDYVITRESDSPTSPYKIIFTSNVSPVWKRYYGGYTANSVVNIQVSPACLYVTDPRDPNRANAFEVVSSNFFNISDDISKTGGYLKSGQYLRSPIIERVCIFPQGEGSTGYVVKKIVVVYDWDNPSIVFGDLEDQITLSNLMNVKFEMYPIILKDEPAPLALNGRLLDPTQMLADLDATTVENLSENEWQKAKTQLESGDVSITLPFLDAAGCVEVSQFIYELQNQVAVSTTYVCGPNSEPELGQTIDGKTIYSIDYSYQDSSQYYISVQAGPIWQGFGGWDNAVYQNRTDRVQVEGEIRGVYNDNTRCQVRLERFGIMECINGTPDVLEIGDIVKVTLFNNPVSL